LPGANGFFQVGTLGTLSNTSLRLRARNTNCAPLQVRLITGWGCDPGAGPQAHSCGRDTALVELRLLNAVLELNPLNQPDDLPLCEPSDWFVVEILNANDGNALQLLPSVQLPQGMRVQAGATQVAYPAGSGWVNAPDPQVLSGNLYQWKLEDLLPILALDGLPGFQNAPANAFQIRFKVIADCGFVANAQPIYGVDGLQPCGAATNRLRKPGDPVGLEGVGQPYSVDIQLTAPGGNDTLFCGEQMEVAVQLQIQGTPAPNDSIYLQLPSGISYVPASYAPGQNAPPGPPQVADQTIRLPLPAGLGANAVVRFNIQLAYNASAGCADQFLIAQTRLKVSGFCAAIGQLCDVYLATGEALLPLPVQNPDLILSSFTGTINGGVLQLKTQLFNTGPAPAPGATVFVVLDQNGNGLADPTDPTVQTLQQATPLLPGAALELSALMNIPPAQRCRLLLVIPAAENCACQPKIYPLDTWTIQQTPTALCSVAPVVVGIDSLPGADYVWTPAGLTDCDTCPRTLFRPGPNTQPGDIFTLTLTETADGCVLEHVFEVRFGAMPSIVSPDQTICQGDTVLLEATAGGNYQWAGPGIVQPGSQKQRVSPPTSALYTVTITAADGCTGADSVYVTVLENRAADLGVLRTCPGVPIAFLGTLTDQPGLYTQTYAAANGCDSVVTARLELFDADGLSELSLCAGDSIRVFDTLLTSAGTVCRQFVSAAGCDSLHCIAVNLLPSVQINSPDSVIVLLGDSIQLQGPLGFDTYRWEPATWLSCADCQSPWAVPLEDTMYTLTVGNAAGCTAQAQYRVIVYPPCDPKRLQIPNAITPNGDGQNDVFRVVPFEGFELVREMRIYDRWGKEVYRGAGNAAWDGLVDGQPGVSDTYVYVLTILCDEKEEKIVGDVTVIR
jgi:gliding motility-associated-like protein